MKIKKKEKEIKKRRKKVALKESKCMVLNCFKCRHKKKKAKTSKSPKLELNNSLSDEDQIPDENTPEGFSGSVYSNFEREVMPLTGRVMKSEFNNSKGDAFGKCNVYISN